MSEKDNKTIDDILEKHGHSEEVAPEVKDIEEKEDSDKEDVQDSKEKEEDTPEDKDSGEGSKEKDEPEGLEKDVADKDEGQEEPAPIEMPVSWKKEVREEIKDQWDKLPENFRKTLVERERSNDILSAQNGNFKKELSEYKEAFNPVRAYVSKKSQASNMSEAQYLANLANAEMAIETNPDQTYMEFMNIYKPRDPVGFARKFMQAFNIKPEQITKEVYNPYMDRIISLEAERKKEEYRKQQEEFNQNNEFENRISTAFENFKYKHPEYSDDMEGELAGYISIVKSKVSEAEAENYDAILEKAYSIMSSNKHSTTDQSIIRKEVQKELKEDQKKAVERAKKATSVKGDVPSEPVPESRSYDSNQNINKSIESVVGRHFK